MIIQIRGFNCKEKDLIIQNNLTLIGKIQEWLEFQTKLWRNSINKEESKEILIKIFDFNQGFENIQEKHFEKYYADFEKIYSDESSADFEIQVQEKSYKVHKYILASRSNYFESIFSQETVETEKKILKLTHSIFSSPDLFEIILRYFYLGLYGFKKTTLKFENFNNLLQMCNYFDIKCPTFK